MKIAYLLGSLNRGGLETLLLDVFQTPEEYNFIGVHRKGGTLQDAFYQSGKKLYKLAPKSKFDITYILRLRKLLKRENITIVHAQQYIDALYVWIACVGTKIKLIQTYHGFDDFEKKGKIINFIIKRTDKNIFVSNYQKEYYLKKYHLDSLKQMTIYNGISFEKIDKNTDIAILPQKKSPKATLKIGMVGNFVRGREQNTVCRFLKLLNEDSILFDFYFVGKKNESEPWFYDDCVQYCKDNGLEDSVHFLGSRQDVPAILKQLDAFVYSTDHDTFGIAVIEAIASGIQVFVNDWEVMSEITNDGEYATIYRTKDEQDLLKQFDVFLQNKEEYVRKAQYSAIAVRDKFSIQKHIQQLKELYQAIN